MEMKNKMSRMQHRRSRAISPSLFILHLPFVLLLFSCHVRPDTERERLLVTLDNDLAHKNEYILRRQVHVDSVARVTTESLSLRKATLKGAAWSICAMK